MPALIDHQPAEFERAVESIKTIRLRSEILIEEMPAPRKIAPHAYAISGDVVVHDEELSTGRFIMLFDPAGESTWGGQFRCVTYARADIETEMATDPMLAEVGWSWLTDALNARAASYCEPSGSITIVRSHGFGDMASEGDGAQVEVRASWTPLDEIPGHVEAWADLLASISGLEPREPGVISLPGRRGPR